MWINEPGNEVEEYDECGNKSENYGRMDMVKEGYW